MITKAEAQASVAAYQDRFSARLNQYLVNRAASGLLGGTISYYDEDGLTADRRTALRAELEGAGWTVVVDTTAKTVTIS